MLSYLWNMEQSVYKPTTYQVSIASSIANAPVIECYDTRNLIKDLETLRQGPTHHVKTGTYLANEDSPLEKAEESSPITVADMVAKIRSVFGLNVAQVAEVVGISRPALYKHLNQEPPKDLDSYHAVYRIAERVESEVSGDLSRGLKTVLVNGKTLLQHLYQDPKDADYIVEVASQVADKVGRAAPAVEANASKQRLISRSITRAG